MALRSAERADYISLCSVGGGLDLGVELAIPAARAIVLVEREAPAVATLVAAMEAGFLAPAPVWSDVRSLDGRRFRGRVDGVVGGIPCQPHSVAGKRLGRDDPRDLWSAARRILVQSGAWFVLIENVRGMLSSGGAERVWRDLGRLGFEREIGLFSAAEVGASHERQRLFILGVAEGRCGRWNAWGGCDTARHGRGELDASDGDRGLADADGAGSPVRPLLAGDGEPQCAIAVGVRRVDLVDAARLGRREGWTGSEFRRRRGAARCADGAVGDADGEGQSQPRRGLAEGRRRAGDAGVFRLSPPGPGDADGWRDVLAERPDLAPAAEPWVRRVADGMAAGLDLAGARERDGFRVDALRLLGNGVHPLAAAHALRTLASRLAGRSAGAARLVSMMGDA